MVRARASSGGATASSRARFWRVVGAFAGALLAVGGTWRWRHEQQRHAHLQKTFISYEDGTSRAIEPTVATNTHGDVIVAWMRARTSGPADAIGVRLARAGGLPGPIALVRSPGGRLAADPAIVTLADGTFLLTWLGFHAQAHGDAYDMRVYAARVDPARASTSVPVLVTADAPDREYDRPWSAIGARGRIFVVYRFTHGGKGGIAVASSIDGGAMWEPRELFADWGFGGGLATVCAASAAGGDHVYIAYFDPVLGIVMRRSDDKGLTFPDAERQVVSAPGENVALEAPSCVARDDELVVSYGISAGPLDTATSAVLSHVALARSSDAGRTFDTRDGLAVGGRVLMHPRLLRMDDGSMEVATYAFSSSTEAAAKAGELRLLHARFAHERNDGDVLRDALRMAPRRSDPLWGGDYLGFAALGRQLYIAYSDPSEGMPEVALHRSAR
jgi:hypothetical protein